MRRTIRPLAALAVLSLALPAQSAPGGKLGTLPHGTYVCSTPGDAMGAPWNVIPDGEFTIDTASTYRTATGSGTYLLTDDRLVFTRGPLRGERFVRTGTTTLQRTDREGVPRRVRCVRGPSR
ncbi:elongation factor P [Pelagerythrobacter rhizovicinus]|uniref:Elongation factor P n=1 Tax=Pelagerythrobacter rhizovicinus TaxID=2268576 RepID=A0A4Q2KRI6_9SPHN|nr:elongation factor P [Pelagerythrobacter rhizovicinus]RXZ66273.1 elongation factor P [Pelagerythrobacter rhizovicinus]